MANVNAPSGLAPVQYMDGSPWNGMGRLYYIASTDTNAYAIGDPVTPSGDGSPSGVMGVTLATAGSANVLLGAIVSAGAITEGGPLADPRNLSTIIIPATKTVAYWVMVADDPSILYEIQEGGSGTVLASTAIGLNVNLKSGTNNGFLSGWVLDNATTGTGATIQLKLFGLVRRVDNAFGTSAKWLVRINTHFFSGGTSGI